PSSESTTPEHAAAAFGIAYAIECLPAEARRSVQAVTIQRIWWHPLHPRAAALAYAAAMALWESFGGAVPNPPPFSEPGQRVVFPLSRGGRPAYPAAAADGRRRRGSPGLNFTAAAAAAELLVRRQEARFNHSGCGRRAS